MTAKDVRISLIEPGAVDTELTEHITDAGARRSAEEMYSSMHALTAEDIADAILYVVSRPAHVAINEVLVRPADQVQP